MNEKVFIKCSLCHFLKLHVKLMFLYLTPTGVSFESKIGMIIIIIKSIENRHNIFVYLRKKDQKSTFYQTSL